MSAGRVTGAHRLWGGQLLLAGASGAVLLTAPVDLPAPRIGPALAAAAGLAAGVALALLLAGLLGGACRGGDRGSAGAPPAAPAPMRARRGTRCALAGAVALAAACEEVVWRGGVLMALCGPVGAPAALAIAAAGFGAVHGPSLRRAGTHLLTGLVFGGVHLATGRLAAPVLAHVAHNLVLLALDRRAAAPAVFRPAHGEAGP